MRVSPADCVQLDGRRQGQEPPRGDRGQHASARSVGVCRRRDGEAGKSSTESEEVIAIAPPVGAIAITNS
jgi:hypothetical protein